MTRQLTALGGDIFAGLFTVGIQRAGYRVLGHLEHGAYGVATARKNFPDLDIRIGPHEWKPQDFTGRVDFMYCNPPCAAWSNMRLGAKQNWREQTERLACVQDLTRAGTIIRPKAWCWESVVGAWRNGREFVLEIASRWNSRGYDVTILLQNNMYLGVPQSRERMFLIAHKHPLVWQPFTKPMTVRQALKRAPSSRKAPLQPKELSPLHAELWERCGETRGAGSSLRVPFELMTREDRAKFPGGAPLTVFRRLGLDTPGPVMMEANKRLHPTEPRMLTYTEWLSMCGLPWDWQTGAGSFSEFSMELSRAVMPPVGEWLGRSVAAGIAKRALTHPGGCRLVDLRKPDDIIEETLWDRHESTSEAIAWNPPVPPPKPERKTRAGSTRSTAGRQGIGQRIRDLLELGEDAETILAAVHSEFPTSKATASDISWNRRKIRLINEEKNRDNPPW